MDNTKGMSNQLHPKTATLATHLIGPDARLCLADMSLMQQYHTQAALTYATTDRER